VETNVQKLTNLEYRALRALAQDARMPAADVAKAIGVSRVTASRAIWSLKKKGVRFVPEYYDGSVKAFVVVPIGTPLPALEPSTGEAQEEVKLEAYDLLDGDRMLVVEAADLDALEKFMKKLSDKKAFYVATKKLNGKLVKAELICDYCGGKIKGEPLVFRRGRRIYYACCNGCLNSLKKRVGQPERTSSCGRRYGQESPSA